MREGNEERIALRIDLRAGVRRKRRTKQNTMLRKHRPVIRLQLLTSSVEPSTSVNRNVTIPLGKSATPPPVFSAPVAICGGGETDTNGRRR